MCVLNSELINIYCMAFAKIYEGIAPQMFFLSRLYDLASSVFNSSIRVKALSVCRAPANKLILYHLDVDTPIGAKLLLDVAYCPLLGANGWPNAVIAWLLRRQGSSSGIFLVYQQKVWIAYKVYTLRRFRVEDDFRNRIFARAYILGSDRISNTNFSIGCHPDRPNWLGMIAKLMVIVWKERISTMLACTLNLMLILVDRYIIKPLYKVDCSVS